MFKINIGNMQEFMAMGIRRASAFMRLGLDDLEQRGLGDFNLSASIVYSFWPDEVSDEDRAVAREEYRSWMIGSCLRELDQFYSMYLDRVWTALEAADLHGSTVRSDYQFDQKFARITNVAQKHRLVAERLNAPEQFEQLNSLSLARNALTHNVGYVRSPVDCNSDDRTTLSLKWLALDMVISRGGEDRVVAAAPFDTNDLPGDGESTVSVRYSPRELNVPADQKIPLTAAHLAELCMFYQIISSQVIDALVKSLKTRGIVDQVTSTNDAGQEAGT